MAEIIAPEARLATLKLNLPNLPAPGGNYVSAKRAGATMYLSGVVSTNAEGVITGTAGGAGIGAIAGAIGARVRTYPACSVTPRTRNA